MDGATAPLVTYALVTFNQEDFVRESVESAFAQDYSPLEIIISDDCSTDRTFETLKELVEEFGAGREVILRQNETNQGVCEHVNTVFDIARGDFIVVAAGDDISLPNRTSALVGLWQKEQLSAIYSNAFMIDRAGRRTGLWKDRPTATRTRFVASEAMPAMPFYGAAAGYDAEIFRRFGRLPRTVRNEDFNLALRAALLGGLGWIKEPLLCYRQHADNLSFWSKKSSARGMFERLALRRDEAANTAQNYTEGRSLVLAALGSDCPFTKSFDIKRLRLLVKVALFEIIVDRKLGATFRLFRENPSILAQAILIEMARIVAWPLRKITARPN